ncbi:AAEL005296-PA [Aedes aegypti]|uniref:Fatty acyl-CoA reductase n=1 Tax=Aedes aegypti TaxID=7159 RepID=Q17AH6_AEDAE|nr:AAEL005296-PA [Aedes aegypti]
MSTFEAMRSEPLKSIPETFAGVDVFITGGSGFMGKVLIEKLLRSCPDIGQVFVLLREKKGKSSGERVQELVKIPLFDKIRETHPDSIQKIVPIPGDCSLLKMGLNEDSQEKLKDVQFVFHAAASVRFDDPLCKAILLNTRGTREVFRWAKTLKNLRALVHISTTYCNPEIFDIEERIYPAKMDWQKAIEIAERMEPEVVETLSQKLTGFSPNTYTFTKGLAEQICYDYQQELPVVIFRPSIVTNSEREPLPGWIDNFNGPTGLLVGMGTGVVRSGCIKLNNHINCIPVDVSIKAIIIAAWKRANSVQSLPLTIYNSAAEVHKTADYRFLVRDGEDLYYKTPATQMLWFPGGLNAPFKLLYYVLFFFFQIIPSMLLDALLKLSGRKPMLLRLQRRIFDATISLMYFTENEWVFKTDNFRALQSELLEQDRETFDINYITNGLSTYFAVCILGARRYLFKEKDDTIPAAKKKMRRLMWIHGTIKYAFFVFIGYMIFSKFFFPVA